MRNLFSLIGQLCDMRRSASVDPGNRLTHCINTHIGLCTNSQSLDSHWVQMNVHGAIKRSCSRSQQNIVLVSTGLRLCLMSMILSNPLQRITHLDFPLIFDYHHALKVTFFENQLYPLRIQ